MDSIRFLLIQLTLIAMSLLTTSCGGAGQQAGGSRLLSANKLYREFVDNPVDASDNFVNKTVSIVGRVTHIGLTEDREAFVRFSDGDINDAIIASFVSPSQVRGVRTDDEITVHCFVEKFEYDTLWLEYCYRADDSASNDIQIIKNRIPTANLLFREFENNYNDAASKYLGETVRLEGWLNHIVELESGGVAIHIADQVDPTAIIATFPRRSEIGDLEPDDAVKMVCLVDQFEYSTLWLENCRLQ